MTTIHFIDSGKANVGKSAFAEIMIAVAMQYKHRPFIIDADEHRQTLSLTVKVDKMVALSDNPALESQPDRIWELAEKKERDVIVDLAGQSDSILSDWIERRGVDFAAESEGIDIIKWWLCDKDSGSFEELLDSAKRFPSIKHVLVRSMFRTSSVEWDFLEQTEPVQKLLDANVSICSFPSIHRGFIDRLRSDSIAIASAAKNESLGVLDKATVKRLIERVEQQISPIYEFKPTKPIKQAKPKKEQKEKEEKECVESHSQEKK